MKGKMRMYRMLSAVLLVLLFCAVGVVSYAEQAEVALTEETWMNEYESISSGFSEELLEELLLRDQAIPEYASDFSSCTDVNKLYVLPDGYVYAYLPRVGGASFRNELLYATDADGSLYSNGLGYVDNMRYSSVSSETEASGWDLTGYIPATPGDVIRLKNIRTFSFDDSSNMKFVFFDYNYDYVSSSSTYSSIDDFSDSWVALSDEEGHLVECIIPSSYDPTISYVRLVARDIRPDSVITVNELINENEVMLSWCRIANAMETKVVISTEKKQENRTSTTKENKSEESANLPEYWLEYLDGKVDQIRQVMEKVGRNKSAFLWYTDAHWNVNARYSPQILHHLYKNTPINKTMFGGDVVYIEPSPEELSDRSIMEYLWEWRAAVRDLPHHHSVVGSHDDGNVTDHIFTDEYVYAYLMAPEECPDIVRGGDFYYYIDDVNERTRYLYLDTACRNVLYDENQQNWVKEALKSTPDQWHIVAIANIWHGETSDAALQFSYGGAILMDLFDQYNSRQEEFASCGARVEFCIGGHSHVDEVRTSATGIPVITTETDSRNVRSDLPKERGTINENSVNAVIADYANRTIHIIRVGRGDDMVIQY